tara:strand:- start:138 stop:410 length:273 start_codon:yes stop_codon:yes gene_type:complete
MAKFRISISVPIDWNTDDLPSDYTWETEIEADNEDDAYDKGYEEVEDSLDVSSVYDELYDEMHNACIYLDGQYDCDFTEYVEVREIKEKK